MTTYDEALADMSTEPPEAYEPQPPRRGRRPGAAYGKKGGGRPRIGSARRQGRGVSLDADILALVQAHAKSRGNSLSESVNMLLAEALRNHEIDAEAGEIL